MVTRRGAPRRYGFTLIEVLIVILVIAVLAAIVIPRLLGAGRQSKETLLRDTLRGLRLGVATFQADTGVYPAQITDLAALTAPAQGVDEVGSLRDINASDFRGPYFINPGGGLPRDPLTGDINWAYSTTPPTVGEVHSSASGQTQDGTLYSDL